MSFLDFLAQYFPLIVVKKYLQRRITGIIIACFFLLQCLRIFFIHHLGRGEINEGLWKDALLLLLAFIAFVGWLLWRKYPKARKDRIGIAIGICCEQDTEQRRLRNDFIEALRAKIQAQHQDVFDVIELQEYHSERLTKLRETTLFLKRTWSHLLIFGRCKRRLHEGQMSYVLELNVSVRHAPLTKEISNNLVIRMKKCFPGGVVFPEAEELNGFVVTRDFIEHASMYILGEAALLSRDPLTAFALHRRLWNEIKQLPFVPSVPVSLGFIQSQLPKELVEEGIYSANWYYRTRPEQFEKKMKDCLDVVQELDPSNYVAHLIKATYFFLIDDIENAKKEIYLARTEKDQKWRFSDAFLVAYEGNLSSAHQIYWRAFQGPFEDFVPLDVEEFIAKVLNRKPDKFQLYYCLGLINFFCKKDYTAAKRDFAQFIAKASKKNQFPGEVAFAKQYLVRCDTELFSKARN